MEMNKKFELLSWKVFLGNEISDPKNIGWFVLLYHLRNKKYFREDLICYEEMKTGKRKGCEM